MAVSSLEETAIKLLIIIEMQYIENGCCLIIKI